MPQLERVDHVHIHVHQREAAVSWYRDVMGFEPVAALAVWAVDGGPLTIGKGDVHLALFEGRAVQQTTVAFSVTAEDYQHWKVHLGEQGVPFSEVDHDLSWSIYFKDPDGNPYEITCYE